jgi:hypothetical protein
MLPMRSHLGVILHWEGSNQFNLAGIILYAIAILRATAVFWVQELIKTG